MTEQEKKFRDLLEECADMLRESQSGFIPGCGYDLDWARRRNRLVTEATDALAVSQGEEVKS